MALQSVLALGKNIIQKVSKNPLNTASSIVLVGHSHIECLQSALHDNPAKNIAVINLRHIVSNDRFSAANISNKLAEKSPIVQPSAICLSVGGNHHNVLGMVENPIPYSIGDSQIGALPYNEDKPRHFISYGMMKDHFINSFNNELIKELYDAFPKARRFYLNPPPPVSDWDHIKANPGIFRDKLNLGPAPNELKRQLYRIQTEVLQELAKKFEATFIEPDQTVFTDDGFLARPYYNNDPTHGNAVYGAIMLEKIIAIVREKS